MRLWRRHFFGFPPLGDTPGLECKLMPRSPQWRTVRAAYLSQHPRCAMCGTTDDLEVHHIRPFHLAPQLELDVGNLITLCEKPGHICHFIAGHFHDWSLANPDVVVMAADYLGRQHAAHER